MVIVDIKAVLSQTEIVEESGVANKRGKKAELPDSSTISVRDKAAFINIELSPLPLSDRYNKVRHMDSTGASLRIMQQTPIFDISCYIHIKV